MYKFHLQNCLWIPIEEQVFGTKMATLGKFQSEYNSKNKFYQEPYKLNLNMEHIQLYKFFFQSVHAYRLVEQICGFKMATSEKSQSTNNSKELRKQVLL